MWNSVKCLKRTDKIMSKLMFLKEPVNMLKAGDIKGLFFKPTTSMAIQFMRYIFVGGAAFVADAGTLWICSIWMHYLIAAAVAFLVGLAVNFALSKLLVFTAKSHSASVEFLVYGLIGAAGLLITEALMYVFTEKAGMYFMISKVITAAIVLIWNFAARKIILYRGDNK